MDSARRRKLRFRVRSWDTQTLENIAANKLRDISAELGKGVPVSTAALPLVEWFSEWVRLFSLVDVAARDRYVAARRGETVDTYDEETAGGILSRDNLKAALTPYMPFRQDTVGIDLDSAPGVLPPDADEDRIADADEDEDEEGEVPEEDLITAEDFALDPQPRKPRGRAARRVTGSVPASRATSKARTRSTAAAKGKGKAKGKAKGTTTKAASKPRPRAKATTTKSVSRTAKAAPAAKAKAAPTKPPPVKATTGAARGSRKPRAGASTTNPPPPATGPPNEMRSRLRSYKA